MTTVEIAQAHHELAVAMHEHAAALEDWATATDAPGKDRAAIEAARERRDAAFDRVTRQSELVDMLERASVTV